MDIDDPRLEQARKELTERIEKFDERIVAVLKGHLGAEQPLNALLKAARRRRRRTFAGKIDIAEKLHLPQLGEKFFAVLKAGNNLRNAVAHGEKEGRITARMTDLRKALIGAMLSSEQRKSIENMTDTQMVSSAFFFCGSHMVVASAVRRL